jgi:hypothetical protein
MSAADPGEGRNTHGAQHPAKDIIERWQVAHLMCKSIRPEPSQSFFLSGDRLLDARRGSLSMSEVGIEFATQLRDARIGRSCNGKHNTSLIVMSTFTSLAAGSGPW